ncbi:stage II sporulation protein P [Paenibacillus oenotherae]|uniref:Stage II sporulation protein P n=1 Tax=Paenibacillus oenotherae TaxID=1435645 RepID=A0ABS7D1E2_9BACL|nr:stage II sporulation protein P [Paenibacillus oenotherae]MBW7473744.1 stage II sporulation protein P [Paenibacillus oenotherae]
MKHVAITWNLGRESQRFRQLLVTGRTFAFLSLGSMIMVIVIGIGSIVHQSASTTPMSSMKGFAAAVSSGLFTDMLEMEMPGAGEQGDATIPLSGKEIGSFLVRLMTDINPSDPKSLLTREYPVMGGNEAYLLRAGTSADMSIEPEDHDPLPGTGDTGTLEGESTIDGSGRPDPGPDEDRSGDAGDNGGGNGTSEVPPVRNTDQSGSNPDKPDPSNPSKPTTAGRDVVFIYHSHNRESWFPLLGDSKYAESPSKNVTLLGKRLQQKLEKEGIGALQSATDYVTAIKKYNWALSYKYSKKTVKDAMASNKDLTFFFDIHRNSLRKKQTTITINGKAYAQVMFIIGQENANWRKNEAFANKIQDKLEKQYPGISHGIWGKTTANGNGEYNQSLSPGSVLIEIGGVDNTLEESYRTVDALAKVIAELYWDAKKVDLPKES